MRITPRKVVSGAACLVVGLLLLASSGCGSRKQVQIPSEWRTPPSATTQAQRAPAPVPPSTASPPAPGLILKPPPQFKEKDVEPGLETIQPPVPEKKQAVVHPPQHLASMHLVDQARAELSRGRPDAAIPVLEQAVQVDVHNGDAFLGLARAWKMKGARRKAVEFAKKAEVLFQDDSRKLKEAYLLEAELYRELGDTSKSNLYKQKASEL